MIRWHRPAPREIDHEMLWLIVSLTAAVAAAGWLWLGLPSPLCPLRQWFHLRCPTCGGTTAIAALFRGDLAGAFFANPAVTLGAFCVALFDFYAATVLLFGSPRLRCAWSPLVAMWLRFLAVAALALSWTYQLVR